MAKTRIGDEYHLIYGDGGDGTYNTYMPDASVDDGDATVTVLNQNLFAPLQDSNVKLLLHFDGSDAATTTKDTSNSAHSPTMTGNAQLDTAQKQFGTSSMLVDGSADAVAIIDSPDWNPGAGDITFDFWLRLATLPSINTGPLLFSQVVDINNGIVCQFWTSGIGDITIRFAVVDATVVVVEMETGVLPLVVDTWYHIAVERDGSGANNWTLYVAGAVEANGTAAVTVPDLAASMVVNADGPLAESIDGWYDEFRIVKGSAEFGGAFTPATVAYGTDERESFRFIRRSVSLGGIIGDASNETVVTVDNTGALYLVAGNDPTNLTLTLADDGAVILTWDYDEFEQPARPTGFKVYERNGGSTVWTIENDVNANTVEPWGMGLSQFRWETPAHANGLSLLYTVRTYRTVASVDYEQVTDITVSGTADAAGPAGPTSMSYEDATPA